MAANLPIYLQEYAHRFHVDRTRVGPPPRGREPRGDVHHGDDDRVRHGQGADQDAVDRDEVVEAL